MLGILQVSKTMIAYGSSKVSTKSVVAFNIVVSAAGTENQNNLILFFFWYCFLPTLYEDIATDRIGFDKECLFEISSQIMRTLV